MKYCFLFALMIFISCSKDNGKKCWQMYDFAGNEWGTICNKSAAEMAELYPNSCLYHEAGGSKYCWMVNTTFIKDKTQKYIEHYVSCYAPGSNAVKADCDYCGKWYSRYKRTYKPANLVSYSPVRLEQLCGDTSKSLYHGRQILIKDTPDSLVILQVSNNGTF